MQQTFPDTACQRGMLQLLSERMLPSMWTPSKTPCKGCTRGAGQGMPAASLQLVTLFSACTPGGTLQACLSLQLSHRLAAMNA